jgi:cell division protein FtsB
MGMNIKLLQRVITRTRGDIAFATAGEREVAEAEIKSIKAAFDALEEIAQMKYSDFAAAGESAPYRMVEKMQALARKVIED